MAGCSGASDTPSAGQQNAYAESAPAVGEPVKFFLYTHCGVESLRLNGGWWHAVSPLYGPEGTGSPPNGWGDPYEQGTLTLDSAKHATFEAEGTKVAFVPAQDDQARTRCK